MSRTNFILQHARGKEVFDIGVVQHSVAGI
jgi:hypothetical protein